jgi:peroxiredoxin
MPALEAGIRAPEINLSDLDGRKFSSKEALQNGPLVAAFFKVSCPVCQFAFPFLERMVQAYGKSRKFSLVGVSQDGAADTKAFNREFGVTFPALLDQKGYPVSKAYGLTNVPTIFLILPEGEIESSTVGWSKAEMEQLNQKLAEISGQPAVRLFGVEEKIPDYKPG